MTDSEIIKKVAEAIVQGVAMSWFRRMFGFDPVCWWEYDPKCEPFKLVKNCRHTYIDTFKWYQKIICPDCFKIVRIKK